MAMLEEVGTYIGANTSFTLGTDLYLALIPDTPDNCVAIYENVGVTPLSTLGSTDLPQIERPDLQVIVRNTSYATGRSNIETVYRLLTAVENATLSSVLYHRIEATTTPYVYERDDSRRIMFTCNFNVMKALS